MSDSRYKVVRDYDRVILHQRMERSYVRLYCGRTDSVSSESKFGYRHIKDEHRDEWERKAFAMGRGWQDLVGWMMDWVAYDSDRVTVPNRKRFCYQRKFFYVVGDDVLLKTRAIMILGKTGVRIMTFFPNRPGGSGYCAGRGPTIRHVR